MTEAQFKTEEKTIGDHQYRVVLFPGGPGFELLFELKNVLGDSIGSLFGGQIEDAISKIGGDLSKKEVLDLILRLLQFTYVDSGTQGIDKVFFDTHFAGKYGQLLKVLAFVTEVNFGDFFDETRRSIVAMVEKLGKGMDSIGGQTIEDLLQSQKH